MTLGPLTKLTKLELAFVRAIVETDDLEHAAQLVFPGMKRQFAVPRARTMRNRPAIAEAIERARQAMLTRLGWGKAETLQELTHLASFNPQDYFNEDGTPKKLHDLDEDKARALGDMEFAVMPGGAVIVGKMKTTKMEALKLLAKANGMLDRGQSEPPAVYNFDLHFNGEPPTKEVVAKAVNHVLDIQTGVNG